MTLHVRWRDGTEVSFTREDFGEDMFVDIDYPDQIRVRE